MSDELIGKAFGPYVLQDFIKPGGMARIYLGYHAALERSVAVKVMSGDLLRDPNFLTRFTNEARMLARLSHPHILPVFDFGEAHGMPYIVMPLMTGSLQDRLTAGQPLPVNVALPLLTAMAEALDYAHTQGVLHRDVKPNNVLFDAHGNPYLADFGIAKSLQATSGLTGTGIVGTLEYMSPEQARGDALDGRSDVYSLAMVAYQLLTGQLAFSATTPAGYIFKHISEPPRPPREVNPQLPAQIETVLLRGLAKDAGRRYQTAQDFARALADAYAHSVARTPTVAHGEEAPRSVVEQPRAAPPPIPTTNAGWPSWAWGAGLIGLLAVVGLGWALSRLNATPIAQATATLTAASAITEAPPASATPAPTRVASTFTPAPTPTAGPTRTPTSLPTAPIAAVNEQGGFIESFTSNTSNWPTGDYETERETGRRSLGEGRYRWQMRAKEGVFTWVFGDQQTFADLRASVTVTQTGGADTVGYGLILRSADQTRFDAFLVNQRGEYALVRFAGGQFTNLIGWTASAALRTEGANALALETSRSSIVLFINGQPVGVYADAAPRPDSAVGFVVDAAQGQDLEVEFAELEVRPRWRAVVRQDFSQPSGFNTLTLGPGNLKAALEDERYVMDTNSLGNAVSYALAGVQPLSAFSVAADFQMRTGADQSSYGLVFRHSPQGYFHCSVLENQLQFGCFYYSAATQQWSRFRDWTATTALKQGAVNHLEVRGQGNQFVFLINRWPQYTFTNDALSSGVVGVAVQNYNAGDAGVFAIDNFEVRVP